MRCALIYCVLAIPAFASAQVVSCPLMVSEGTVTVSAPAGWRAASQLARLEAAGMYRGDPARLALLVPDSTKRTKNGTVDMWKFNAGEEKWLWCGYAAETIRLTKKMDDAATRCEVTGREERPGVYVSLTLVCR